MPWKESRIVDQRLQFSSSYQKEEMSVADTHAEKGPSNFDVTHAFTLSAAQDLWSTATLRCLASRSLIEI
jgi:hypothetical protein